MMSKPLKEVLKYNLIKRCVYVFETGWQNILFVIWERWSSL